MGSYSMFPVLNELLLKSYPKKSDIKNNLNFLIEELPSE
jgi:hypothetical protein